MSKLNFVESKDEVAASSSSGEEKKSNPESDYSNMSWNINGQHSENYPSNDQTQLRQNAMSRSTDNVYQFAPHPQPLQQLSIEKGDERMASEFVNSSVPVSLPGPHSHPFIMQEESSVLRSSSYQQQGVVMSNQLQGQWYGYPHHTLNAPSSGGAIQQDFVPRHYYITNNNASWDNTLRAQYIQQNSFGARQPYFYHPLHYQSSESQWCYGSQGNSNKLGMHSTYSSGSLKGTGGTLQAQGISARQSDPHIQWNSSRDNNTANRQIRLSGDNITFADLRPLFGITLANAAKQLGICVTQLKKVCRNLNIDKWPYRQIHSLDTRLNCLERALREGGDRLSIPIKHSYEERIIAIKGEIERVKDKSVKREEVQDNYNNRATSADSDNKNNLTISNLHDTSVYSSSSSLVSTTSTRRPGDMLAINKKGEPNQNSGKKRRHDTTYNYQTGWVANCSTCGKVGKYRHPSEGRVFQHSSGSGKYCGYYRDNPRPDSEAYVRQPE